MNTSAHMTRTAPAAMLLVLLGVAAPLANDWPEFRGEGRVGVWTETGILETFPEAGLDVRWRTPIHHGFSGPSVSDGRIFITDFERARGLDGTERILCLDEETGEIVWTQSWEASYLGVSWDEGPRATPTVDGDQVYAVGASGIMTALKVDTGEVLWRIDFVEDFGAEIPQWGFASAPIVDGERVITLVGGTPDAKVVAFDRTTGAEVWRALSSVEAGAGVAQPVIIEAGGVRQLVIWHPLAVSSLDPATGEVYWEQPFEVGYDMTVATPVRRGSDLFVTTFYDGPMMLGLDNDRPDAEMRWRGDSHSEILTDGLHAVIGTPIIEGDYIYGFGSYGQLRCLVAATGERVWETQEATGERARWTSAFLVKHEDRVFINNDRGDLIIAKLSPEGYEEISRTSLLKPTSRPGNRRELTYVNWSHPAYANKHIIARNDEEIISASLAAP
ncbi:MAG: PQQ-binding-like beta-propeller repeat protein [Acidobacteriota bacterium]|nr:PQQ-binding-like beta-propeller repeat protein [Acidobacteriota bacterium]